MTINDMLLIKSLISGDKLQEDEVSNYIFKALFVESTDAHAPADPLFIRITDLTTLEEYVRKASLSHATEPDWTPTGILAVGLQPDKTLASRSTLDALGYDVYCFCGSVSEIRAAASRPLINPTGRKWIQNKLNLSA